MALSKIWANYIRTIHFLIIVPLIYSLSISVVSAQNYLRGRLNSEPIKCYDILHYRLNIQIQPEKKTLTGTAQIWFVPTCDTLSTISLDADSMEIKSITLNPNQQVTWSHRSHALQVALGSIYTQHDTLILSIDYTVTATKKGLYFNLPDENEFTEVYTQGEMEDNHYWFPCWDYPNDRATSEIIATIPMPNILIANGRLLTERKNSDHTTTFHWQMPTDHVSYLISLVAGDYARLLDHYKNIPLEYVVHPSDSIAARATFRQTPAMIQYFEQFIGIAYPYNRYSQAMVHDYFYGGMENITATTLNYSYLKDKRTLIDSNADDVISHELAHQWWGDLITCRSWQYSWLNEGFATYFESLWTEHTNGETAFQLEMNRNAQIYFGEDEIRHRRTLDWNRFERPLDVFDAHAYQKGAWVLHMLRHELGETDFKRAMQYYAKMFTGKCVTSADFQHAVEEVIGKDLSIFFQQWVRCAGYPDLRITQHYDESNKELILDIYQQQKPDSLVGLFDFSAEIEITTPQQRINQTVRINSDSCHITLPCNEEPLMTIFDPHNWLLKKIEFNKTQPEWLYQLSHADGALSRLEASRELHLSVDQAEVCEALIQQFKQESVAAVRREILQALSDASSSQLNRILPLALHDPNSHVRADAVTALADVDSQTLGTFDTLLAIYHTDSSYSVQKAALKSAIKVDSNKAIALIQEALQTDSFQDNLRLSALISIRDIHNPVVIATVLPFIEKPYNSAIRYQALQALTQLDENDDRLYAKLLVHLNDPYPWIRRLCASTLVKIDKTEALPQLQAAYEEETSERVKKVMATAITALQKSKDKQK